MVSEMTQPSTHAAPAVANVPHIAPPWQAVTDLEFLTIVDPMLALAEFASFAGWMRFVQAPVTESSARAVRRDAHSLGLTRPREGSRGHYACINFGNLWIQNRAGQSGPLVHTQGAPVDVVEAALELWHSRPRQREETP